jgi:hypothetical protein
MAEVVHLHLTEDGELLTEIGTYGHQPQCIPAGVPWSRQLVEVSKQPLLQDLGVLSHQ